MISFESIKTLTFDCYGTLIDWEAGILQSLKPILTKNKIAIDDNLILEKYAEFESALEKKEYKPYKKILHDVLLKFGDEFSFYPGQDELEKFSVSPTQWPPFGDSASTLKQLKKNLNW